MGAELMTKEMPTEECDLIMKGGITSGIVYPKAIFELSRRYRLRSVGGSSAGAIGAVLAAAAEYRRQKTGSDDGFEGLAKAHETLGENLGGYIQPSENLKPLYKIACRVGFARPGESKLAAFIFAVIRTFPLQIIGAVVLGGIFAWALHAFMTPDDGLEAIAMGLALIAGILLAGIVAGVFVLRKLRKLITRDFVRNDFGMCPGISQTDPKTDPGFVDWMHEQIEALAGPGREGPLRVGNLRETIDESDPEKRVGIEIASMTTDLSTRRPYQLPLENEEHYFNEAEFRRILPAAVVDYLVSHALENSGGLQLKGNRYFEEGVYLLPVGDAFPVILVARMSLSFPGLISGLPLYRVDMTLKDGEPEERLRRCVFSDGGISSNFPIHVFDSFLPSRPTFGIALGEFSVSRGSDAIDLPDDARPDLPVWEVRSVPAFLMSIVNTAKDWQDGLQSLLPGYAERIVTIRLNKKQGGLNLSMDEDAVRELATLGGKAADRLLSEFDFDLHRNRRALTLMPALEGRLEKVEERYAANPAEGRSYRDVLLSDRDTKYAGTATWREQSLEPFAASLSAIGEEARLRRERMDGSTVQDAPNLPKGDSEIRSVASANRKK